MVILLIFINFSPFFDHILIRQVRKRFKKKNISAIEIQRIYLGWKQRKQFRVLLSRLKAREKEEKDRRARLRLEYLLYSSIYNFFFQTNKKSRKRIRIIKTFTCSRIS